MNKFNLSSIAPAEAGVLDHFDGQFADPLSFLREMVQNAIDAGSIRVEVSCSFDAEPQGTPRGDGHRVQIGTAIICVADFGEGMNCDLTDSHATRLLSADKEGDAPQPDSYGLPWKSVFALKPDAVCVDTGRYGDYCRLVFRADRTFTRVRLNESGQGTTVRLWKEMARSEFEALEQGVRRALQHDCPHVDVVLRYQGKTLGAPLDLGALDAPVKTAVFEQEAFIVVGFTKDGALDLASFYRRGLTLLERPSELVGISYKVNSPRLEASSGRDYVIPDAHYHQILSIVRRLATGALVDALSQQLDDSLRQARAEAETAGLQRRLASLLQSEDSLPEVCAQRVVACSPHGQLFTLLSCQEAARKNQLYAVSHPSPLSAAVCADDQIVLEDWQGALLYALCQGEPPRLERVLFLPLPIKAADAQQGAAGEALCAATLTLLKAAAAPVGGVQLGYLDYPGSGASGLLAVVQAQPFALSRLAGALPRDQRWAIRSERSRNTWVLNADHPSLKALMPLAVREPELAAYSLIKMCLLGGPLTLGLDSALLSLAMSRRGQRRESPLAERLIASLTAGGEIDFPDILAVNPELAREKIRRARSPNPLRYILDLVQAAALKGATQIAFKFSAGNMQMHFDGEPFTQADFEGIYASLLHQDGGRDAEARRLLAMGLCTALQVDPARIQVDSGDAFVELRPGHPDRHEVFEKPTGLTHIHLEQRLGLGLIKRYVDHLGGHLTEELLLKERCVHARSTIRLNGRLISQGHTLSDVTPWRPFALGEISGAVGIAPLPPQKPVDSVVAMSPETVLPPTLLRLVHNGVWVDTQLPIELPPGFRGLAESSAFRLDIAGDHVVQDVRYAAALRAVATVQVELLAALCRRFLKELSGEAEESNAALPAQHLRALLRGLLFRLGGLGPILRWAQIPMSRFPPNTIAEGNPGWPAAVADGLALLEVPIFPCTTGELVSLGQILADFIEHRSVAYSVYRSRQPDLERPVVLHIAEPGSEALLRGLFGDSLDCRDAAARLAWEREHGMTAWQRRAYRPTLGSHALIARVPLVGPGLIGEIGLEPQKLARAPWKRRLNQPCTLRLLLIKDGCLLTEKMIPFPLPDLTVAVSGEFAARYLFDDVLSDSQLAVILESVWSALPLLVEKLVQLWGEIPPEGGATTLSRDDETLAWWACVLRRLLMLAVSAKARQAVRSSLDLPPPASGEGVGSALLPHSLWAQLRELPLFEALDGTPLRLSDLEAAAIRYGYLAVLCPSPPLHPKRLESWASLCHTELARTELWSDALSESFSEGPNLAPTSEPPPFILWLAPCERALREPILRQMPPTKIVDAELWLRAATARAADHRQHHQTLTLPEECDLYLPLSGVEGMLGVVSESGFLRAREQEPRVAVALLKKRHNLGSEELWLPGGQFLSAVVDHPQLELTADLLDIADNDAMLAVRTALSNALPELLAQLARRPLPWSPLHRRLLLDAVTALFPRPAFRLAYERLRLGTDTSQDPAQHSANMERDYAALLRLAVATSRDHVEAVLEHHLAQPGPLSLERVTWDVLQIKTASWMSVSAEQEAAALSQAPAPPPGAMVWVAALYPDTEQLPMSERCLCLLPALAAAPLLLASDGAPLRFAEVISDFERHGHVLYSSRQSLLATIQKQRPVILDTSGELVRALQSLFGPDNVREEARSEPDAPPSQQPALKEAAAQRGAELQVASQSLPATSVDGAMLVAVAEELRAITVSSQRLFDDANLACLRIEHSESSSAVVFEGKQCIINSRHPAVQLMQHRFAADPQCVRFLVSAVYTAVTSHLGPINDEESEHFHHQLAVRALAAARHP